MEEMSVHPFLTTLAVKRTEAPEIPGYYSATQHMWVLPTEDGEIPFIIAAQKALQSGPVTRVHGERDLLLDGPVTKIQGERDNINLFGLLELVTKTLTRRERDDLTGPTLDYLLELATKTETRQERDDQ